MSLTPPPWVLFLPSKFHSVGPGASQGTDSTGAYGGAAGTLEPWSRRDDGRQGPAWEGGREGWPGPAVYPSARNLPGTRNLNLGLEEWHVAAQNPTGTEYSFALKLPWLLFFFFTWKIVSKILISISIFFPGCKKLNPKPVIIAVRAILICSV